MSSPINITAEKRSALGTRANRRLRGTGLVPGVIYGHKLENVNISVVRKELAAHLAHGAHLFSLSIDGKSEPALVKDVQYDHLGEAVVHIDFARVDLNERVTITVPIELKGDPKGEKENGVLQQTLNELEIECVVTEIPDAIIVDVNDMGLDSAIHVSDLKVSAGTVIITDAELLVCKVAEVEEQPEEEAVNPNEPELIGKDEVPAGEAEEKK